MKPVAGAMPYGVHKDLIGDMVDDPVAVADAYAFVRLLGDTFLRDHPDLSVVDSTVVDVVFKHPDGSKTQRVEWQALVKES